MSFLTILILGFGLSMDAFAVSVCKGLAVGKAAAKTGQTAHYGKAMICAALWFGLFQGLMPLLGYLFGSFFAGWVEAFASWIAFLLLALIGGNMIREAVMPESEEEKEEEQNASLNPWIMFALAVATSIDALAVGITFSVVPVAITTALSPFWNTMAACALITLETGILSALGIRLGATAGARYKNGAEIAGGVILILIGLRILLSHYGILG